MPEAWSQGRRFERTATSFYQTFASDSGYRAVKPPLFDSVIRLVLRRDKFKLRPYDAGGSYIYLKVKRSYIVSWLAKKQK